MSISFGSRAVELLWCGASFLVIERLIVSVPGSPIPRLAASNPFLMKDGLDFGRFHLASPGLFNRSADSLPNQLPPRDATMVRGSARHLKPHPANRLQQACRLKIPIRSGNGVWIHHKLLGQLADRRYQVSRAQYAFGDRELHSVSDLAVNRPLVPSVQLGQNHRSKGS
jgi:hypothetical protein